MRTYTLCGKTGCCPVVEVDEYSVRIGEKGNLCTLTADEWKTLKAKIKSGKIQ